MSEHHLHPDRSQITDYITESSQKVTTSSQEDPIQRVSEGIQIRVDDMSSVSFKVDAQSEETPGKNSKAAFDSNKKLMKKPTSSTVSYLSD